MDDSITLIATALVALAAGYFLHRISARQDHAAHRSSLPGIHNADIETWVQHKRTIDAMRRLRQRDGLGLKNAKDQVDTMAIGLHPTAKVADDTARAR
ncbi:hypothetical protein [Oleiagrimonas sp. C23AA]|uniref:hypothetical protein n=1 Tax=Oleiagrimonas sp. C23AA TaxID=2719047 RepID=UPI001423C02A|nr:hypothetical protein [Oleiagrimonas sp. C23AA]NII10271.1 hypothetical protein [Oleiagrimonas sp. C23AA]